MVAKLEHYGESAQIVAYLHDVLEDTPVSYTQLQAVFGRFVADCVAIVSDEPGRNRSARKTKTYQKMAKVSGELELALLVKAADRLANMRACVVAGKTYLLAVYKSEHAVFKAAAYRGGLCDNIWRDIEAEIKG